MNRQYTGTQWRTLGFLTVVFSLLLLPAADSCCGPISGKDDLGRTITLPHKPERIVLLTGTPLDVIYELGRGKALVGVVDAVESSYPGTVRRYPSILEKERVGRFSDPNIEKIMALDPDLIIPFGSSDSPGRFSAVFDRWGLPYAAFCSVESVAYGAEQILRIGTLLGVPKRARKLAGQILAESDALTADIESKISSRPLVYYWWGAKNGTYGRRSAVHDLIERAGGTNLTRDFNVQYMNLSQEYVIQRNPDIIIISYWKECQKEPRIKALKAKPGFADLNAVKNNRIYTIEGHEFHTQVRFPHVIRTLAGFIHPEIKNDLIAKKGPARVHQ